MKPLALINPDKVAAGAESVLQILGSLGYSAVCVTDGPPVSFATPGADRRERIATAVMAGLCAREGLAYKNYGHMAFMAVDAATALIKELDK